MQKREIKSKANFLKLSKQLDVRNRLGWIQRAHGLAEVPQRGAEVLLLQSQH